MTQKIEIIFDGTRSRNYGWYWRTVDANGKHEEQPIDEDWWEDVLIADSVIRSWAVGFFFEPDGMTDQEIEELRQRIEVKRP